MALGAATQKKADTPIILVFQICFRVENIVTTTLQQANLVAFTAEDSGAEFHVTPGYVLYALLEENPSTGFRWEYRSENGPIVLDYDRFSAGQEHMMGNAGVHLFAFRIPRPPDSTTSQRLVFESTRPHETGGRTVNVRFVVSRR